MIILLMSMLNDLIGKKLSFQVTPLGRVVSVDGRFKLSTNWVSRAQAAYSRTTPTTGGEATLADAILDRPWVCYQIQLPDGMVAVVRSG